MPYSPCSQTVLQPCTAYDAIHVLPVYRAGSYSHEAWQSWYDLKKWHGLQVSMLFELIAVNREDEEFMLQIAHSLLPLLMCQATRTVLLDNTQVALHPGFQHCLT